MVTYKKIFWKVSVTKLRVLILGFMLVSMSTNVMSQEISSVSTSNPNGQWSYGWSAGYKAAFNLYNIYNAGDGGTWYSSTISNPWNIPQIHSYNNYLALHPGTNYEESILRYKVTHTDNYRINVTFNGANGCGGGATTNTRVYINGNNVFNGSISGNTTNYVTDVILSQNDVVDIAVGPGPLRIPNPPDFTCDTTFIYGSVTDITTPDTSIVSGPNNLTNNTNATFNFASSESNSTFLCSIDDAVYALCTNPVSYTNLDEAIHSLKVKAADAEGNTDPTPATFSWAIDTTVPKTTITKKPADPTNSTSAEFEFSATEVSTFQCSLDGAAYTACSSLQSYTGLTAGRHAFSVNATDTAGNTDATPASYTWVIDTTAPTASTSPAGGTYNATQSVTLTANEPATIYYTLDGSTPTIGSAVYNSALSISSTTTLKFFAKDSAGNSSEVQATIYSISTPTTGTQWQQTSGPQGAETIQSLAIDPSNSQTIYAGTLSGDIYKSTNGGDSWDAVNNGLTIHTGWNPVFSLEIDPSNSQTLYAAISGGGVFKSTNGGASWNAVNNGHTSSDIRSIAIVPTSPQTIYVGGYRGIYKTTNGGTTWAEVAGFDQDGVHAIAIDPTNQLVIYAGVRNGEKTICKSTNGGASWTVIANAAGSGIYNINSITIDQTTPQTIYVAADEGVFKSTDSGTTWNKISSISVMRVRIDPASQQTLYAAATYGEMIRSSDGGNTWSGISLGNAYDLAIDPSAPQRIYVGTRGGVYKTIDSGTSWSTAINGFINSSIGSITIDPTAPQNIYASDMRNVYKSIDWGNSWSQTNVPPTSYINSMAIARTTPATVYGTGGYGLYKSTDGGTSWSIVNSHDYIHSVFVDPTDQLTIYGVGNEHVYKSIDGGSSWSDVSNGLVYARHTCLAVDPSTPQTLYVGTYRGQIYKSTDGGVSWRDAYAVYNPDTAIRSIVIDPITPQTVYAANYSAGVLKSINGGNTWSYVNNGLSNTSVTSLVINPVSPETIYVGTSVGVFESTNGGNSWSKVDNGLNSRGVISLAISPNSGEIVYAGTVGAGVFKTQAALSNQPPSIVSPNSTTFTVGVTKSFAITATGMPSPTVSLTSGTLPTGVAFSNGVLSGTPAVGTAGAYNLVFTASNGTLPDSDQNFALTVALSTVPDTTPPVGTISINNGAASTNATTVSLTLSATDDSGTVTQMQFSNDNSSWSGWQPYATSKAWSLFAGTGTKIVYAQFKDAAGNIVPVSDSISYEAAATTTVNTGSNVIIAPVPQVQLTFPAVTTTGSTTVTVEANPAPPTNFRVITGSSYNIAPPTGAYTLPVTISMDYSDAALADSSNESRIKLFHYNSSTSSWEDITTSVDTVNNRVYGLATSFSPFILGEPTTTVTTAKVPVMNGWWLIPAGLMGIGVMRRRRK